MRCVSERRRRTQAFYFVPAEWVRECSTESLPCMQELRDVHLKKMKTVPCMQELRDVHLKKMKTAIASAFNGDGIMKRILFASHRCGKTRVSPRFR